jgi:uncharacterized protein
MIILLHTSKTMRRIDQGSQKHAPLFLDKATELAAYIQTLTPDQLTKTMQVSRSLADVVAQKYQEWDSQPSRQSIAVDSFIGDIYSGLQASTFTEEDREYADTHLRILSGLYGVLRPLDGISPYRLELAYRLPDSRYSNLYTFWGDTIAQAFPDTGKIINLAAVEYSRLVTQYLDNKRFITPRFLTMNEKTGEPVFVVVHAKIARGAFARWMITSRIESIDNLHEFNDIGYIFDEVLSTPNEPVFVCREFGGKGLSMRLDKKDD